MRRNKRNVEDFHDYSKRLVRRKSRNPVLRSKENVAIEKGKSWKNVADGIKCVIRREPLPMKLRALPRSFWQQPNRTCSTSPGLICSRLPSPLKEETLDEDEELKPPEFVSDANTDLLFSLFQIVDDKDETKRTRFRRVKGRGRPKKSQKLIRDEDPYLASSSNLLPLLPTGNRVKFRNHQVVAKLTSENGESNRDYSHILSQLVVQL